MRHKFNIVTYTNQPCAFVLYHSHASCHWVSSRQTCCVSQQMNDTEKEAQLLFMRDICIHPVLFLLTNPSTTHFYFSRSEVTLDPYRISYACHACLPIVCFVRETGYSHGGERERERERESRPADQRARKEKKTHFYFKKKKQKKKHSTGSCFSPTLSV